MRKLSKRLSDNLTIYRRHAGSCPRPENLTKCQCPLWVHGRLGPKRIQESLNTRHLGTAEDLVAAMLKGGPKPHGPQGIHAVGGTSVDADKITLEMAENEFRTFKGKLGQGSQTAYCSAVADFRSWAEAQGIIYLRTVTAAHVEQHLDERRRGGWERNTMRNRLVLLRNFFKFCGAKSRRWIAESPAADPELMPKAKASTSLRLPLVPQEIAQVLAAVDLLPEAQRATARALVLLMLYTGMRISDAMFFERSSIDAENFCKYVVIKNRRLIDLPPELQQTALDALATLPASRVYFFQPDREDDYAAARTALRKGEDFRSAMPGYAARYRLHWTLVKRVLGLAGLEGACHRFRDTFAVNMLASGCDIYTVSKMLGHTDVKITEKHYLKLIPGYQEQMSRKTRLLQYQFPLAG